MLPDAQYVAGWTFVVHYVDMSSRQERIVGITNISKSSLAGGLQSYTAVIGGLESYRKYRVEVSTVTQHGIESCGQVHLTVQTGKRVFFNQALVTKMCSILGMLVLRNASLHIGNLASIQRKFKQSI